MNSFSQPHLDTANALVDAQKEDEGRACLNNEVENQNDNQRNADNHRPNPIIKVFSTPCQNHSSAHVMHGITPDGSERCDE